MNSRIKLDICTNVGCHDTNKGRQGSHMFLGSYLCRSATVGCSGPETTLVLYPTPARLPQPLLL